MYSLIPSECDQAGRLHSRVLQKEAFEVLRLTVRKRGNVVAVAPFCLVPRFHGLVRVTVSLPRSDIRGPLVDSAMPESAFAPILARNGKYTSHKTQSSCLD